MRISIYERVVEIILECCTWIEVKDYNSYMEHHIVINGKLRKYVDRTLMLRCPHKRGSKKKEQIWMIPKLEIEKAFKIYCKKHPTLKSRVKNDINNLRPTDVEQIIKIASYGVIELRLVAVFKK